MEWCEAVERAIPPVFDCYPSEEHSEYEALYRAIDGLGRKQRATVVFYYFNGFSMYGSLTVVVLLMLWLYFGMYIMMLCAEVNMMIGGRE